MVDDKKIAVVIPTYNRCLLLCKTIESVVANSIKETDIYILDNCSTDGTISYVNKIFNKINIIESKTNLGLTNNLIKGLKIKGYQYIMIVEDHDLLTYQCIEKLIRKLDEFQSAAICIPSRIYINQDGETTKKVDREIFEGLTKGSKFLKYSLKRHDFYFPITVMLRASYLHEEHFEAMKSFINYGDIMLWLQLSSRYDLYFFNEKIYYSREREINNSFSNNFINGYDEVISIHEKFHLIQNKKYGLLRILFYISALKRIILYQAKCKINRTSPVKSSKINIYTQKILFLLVKIFPIKLIKYIHRRIMNV